MLPPPAQELLRHGSQRRSRLAVGCCPSRAVLGGEPAYRFVNDFAHCALTEPVTQYLNERDQHAPFDLPALQVTDSNFARINHCRSPVSWFGGSLFHAAIPGSNQIF
ncbi:hypothetical protein [Bradyrhizobium sp. BR 1432]|uniref:hypothetical protein n=1 Tax=Bradyrhizobium sp. BR 1432 TaxID=3447966 RepID=UPI003EE5B5EC